MIDEKFYRDMWGGDSVTGVNIPDYYVFFGFPLKVRDKEAFLKRYGTIEGMYQQYKEFVQSVGLIYYIQPDGQVNKLAYKKTRKEMLADGQWDKILAEQPKD